MLTERGGIGVEGGLDNKQGETTDIRILENPIWQRRWDEFRDADSQGLPAMRPE